MRVSVPRDWVSSETVPDLRMALDIDLATHIAQDCFYQPARSAR